MINDGILTKRDFTILFENDENKRYLPVETTDSISIYSNIILSGDFLQYVMKKGILIHVFDKYGEYMGTFAGDNVKGTGKTLIKQSQLYTDEKRRVDIAKTIIMAAMHNMRANVRYYKRRKKNRFLSEIEQNLTNTIKKMNQAKTIEELMLEEARGRQQYYRAFDEIIADDAFRFEKRTKRPPRNEVNSLIGFGNTILYNRIAGEISKTRLDIRISFLHAANNRAKSLNLDIAEIFKPIIVDRVIFTCLNRGELNATAHFEINESNGGVYLNKEGKRIFLSELERKLYQKITIDGESITYDTLIRREVRAIQKHIESGSKYKAYKYY